MEPEGLWLTDESFPSVTAVVASPGTSVRVRAPISTAPLSTSSIYGLRDVAGYSPVSSARIEFGGLSDAASLPGPLCRIEP